MIMKILIAVSNMNEGICPDPIAAILPFPWPAKSTFRGAYSGSERRSVAGGRQLAGRIEGMSLVARGESFSADSGRVRAGRSAAPARSFRGSHHSLAWKIATDMLR
jgi:hypothetical protein